MSDLNERERFLLQQIEHMSNSLTQCAAALGYLARAMLALRDTFELGDVPEEFEDFFETLDNIRFYGDGNS